MKATDRTEWHLSNVTADIKPVDLDDDDDDDDDTDRCINY